MDAMIGARIEKTPSLQEIFVMLDMLPMPIAWSSLSDRKILFYNKAFTQRFGDMSDSVDTIDDFILTRVSEEQQGSVRSHWSSVWETVIPQTTVEVVEEMALGVLLSGGTVIEVMLGGLILHEKDVCVAFFDDAAERKKEQTSVLRYAYEDFLTGLANRRKLMVRWNQMAGAGQPAEAAFLMMDLDRFKQVNDQLGHDGGDEVLRIVAKRLQSCVREKDLVCRFGGDEFGILLFDFTDKASIGLICERVLETVRAPMDIRGHQICIGTSIGASRLLDHGNTFDEIFKAADEALYQCKIGGRGCWRWAEMPALSN